MGTVVRYTDDAKLARLLTPLPVKVIYIPEPERSRFLAEFPKVPPETVMATPHGANSSVVVCGECGYLAVVLREASVEGDRAMALDGHRCVGGRKHRAP